MKMKLLLTATVAAVVVSSAVAAPPADKGKPKSTGEGCKPRIAVVLKGTLTGVGNPLTVNVTSANHWGKAYLGSGKQITTTTDTKVRGQGMKQLSELKSGFRVLIQARVCKADLANGATPALTASKVIAHDPSKTDTNENENKGKDNKDKDDDD